MVMGARGEVRKFAPGGERSGAPRPSAGWLLATPAAARSRQRRPRCSSTHDSSHHSYSTAGRAWQGQPHQAAPAELRGMDGLPGPPTRDLACPCAQPQPACRRGVAGGGPSATVSREAGWGPRARGRPTGAATYSGSLTGARTPQNGTVVARGRATGARGPLVNHPWRSRSPRGRSVPRRRHSKPGGPGWSVADTRADEGAAERSDAGAAAAAAPLRRRRTQSRGSRCGVVVQVLPARQRNGAPRGARPAPQQRLSCCLPRPRAAPARVRARGAGGT